MRVKALGLLVSLTLITFVGFSQKLYIAENGAMQIQRSDLDGSNLEPVTLPADVGSIEDMVIDDERNFAFWIQDDATNTIVKRAIISPTFGGVRFSTPVDFIRVPLANSFEGLGIDKIARELFVTTSASGSIYKFSLDASPTITVLPAATISSLFQVFGIDVDLTNGKMYFVNQATTRQIQMANLNGSSPSVILNISGTYGSIYDVATHPAEGKIYFSTVLTGVGQIYKADLDGNNPLLIVDNLPNTIKGIAVDPKNGFVYWATGSTTVGRAALDGSGAIDIVTGLSTTNFITLDLSTTPPPKVYWTEGEVTFNQGEIHRTNLDGTDFERYYTGFSSRVSGIDIHETDGFVYWTDGNRAEIKRGRIGETGFETSGTIIDIDEGSGADGLDDIAIDEAAGFIYFSHGRRNDGNENAISKADLNAPDIELSVVDIVDTHPAVPLGITLDLVNDKIYYVTNEAIAGPGNRATIWRANLDGSNQELLHQLSTASPSQFFRDVKIDQASQRVYWSGGPNNGAGFMYFNDINETPPFVSPSSFFIAGGEPRGIDIDPFNSKIYWVCLGNPGPPLIMRANLDGSGFEAIHQVTVSGPSEFIALDLRGFATLLNLVSTSPAANANNVAANSNLVFNFDQNVDGTTVNSTNILITGEQTGQIQGNFSGASTNTITFNPTNDFKAGELIQVSITTSVLSVAGGALINKHYQSFVVATNPSPQNPAFFVQRPIFNNGLNVGVDRVVAMDVDKEGNMDLASIYDGIEGGIAWYQNDGSQGFTRQIALNSTFSDPRSVAAADLDLDGDIDLLSAFNGALHWYENDGAFSFTQILINQIGIGHGIPDMRIADINGDGYLDIVTIFASGVSNLHRIVFFENSGTQSFTRTMFESTINIPQSLELVDMDEDGDIDIAAAGVSGEVGWYENDGNLSFTPHTFTNSLTSQYEGFTIGDFNGDGHVDMAATTTTQTIWMENDGAGNFTERIINLFSGNNDLHAADIDGDGDLDLVGGAIGFRFYENDGVGNFTIRTTSTSVNIQDVFPADVDSDGDMDVIVGGQSSVIAWFENTMPICPTPVTSNAGTDQTICSGTVVSLSGSVTNAPSSSWTTTGDGTFGNASLPVTTYTPGATDISNGTVLLTLTANDPDGAGPCVAVATSITVTIELAATVTAGIAISICDGDVANLTGSFGGSATMVTWSGGAGSFDNVNSLTPIYTPDISEVGIGPVVLSVTTDDPVGICPAVVAITSVTISAQPSANAGANFAICQGATANLSGSIGGAATTSTWSTSGDGTFDNTALLTAAYTPGPSDISSGSVNLTLTTDDPDGAGSCVAAVSSLTLTINQPATATAGADVAICPSDLVVLSGTIGGSASNPMWSTSGSGTFDNNTLLTATYTPGAGDISAGTVDLILTVDASGVCPQVTDQLTVTIGLPVTAGSPNIQSNVSVISNIDVLASSTINPGDLIVVSIVTNPAKGTSVILANNTIDYTATSGTVGADSFVYRICNQCNLCSDGTVTVDILNEAPVINSPALPITSIAGQSVTIPFSGLFSDLNNNIDFNSIRVSSGPTSGATTSFDSNFDLTIDYSNTVFAGTDQLTVEVCDLLGACSQLIFQVDVDGDVTAYNGISPNGDGYNDYFEISNIQFIEPNNTVRIYNRWGDKVFEVDNYDNLNPARRFNGESDSGKELPSGVYFYKITFNSGSPELSGYLTLKR